MFGLFSKKQPITVALPNVKEKNLDRSWEITICKELITDIIYGYLGLAEGKKLSRSAFFFEISLTNKLLLAEFADKVAKGEQKAAEKLIKIDYKIAIHKIDLNDFSYRSFTNITAFQYSLWALDRHMWQMILKYLPKELAKKQLVELEEKGTVFGKQYDMSYLLLAYQEFINSFAVESTTVRKFNWQRIGLLQRLVPAHVANQFCRIDQALFPAPDFKSNDFLRNLYVSDPRFQRYSRVHWFFDDRIGDKFAVVRGRNLGAAHCLNYCGGIVAVDRDYEAIKCLNAVRKEEYTDLKQKLLAPV